MTPRENLPPLELRTVIFKGREIPQYRLRESVLREGRRVDEMGKWMTIPLICEPLGDEEQKYEIGTTLTDENNNGAKR